MLSEETDQMFVVPTSYEKFRDILKFALFFPPKNYFSEKESELDWISRLSEEFRGTA